MKQFISLVVLIFSALICNGQVALKTNLLYDATTTPNLGLEVGLGGKSTINVVYGLNPWSFSSQKHGERKVKHWMLMPEYRRWTCTRFSGHFIGVHLMGGQFNAANVSLSFPGGFFGGANLLHEVRDNRVQGAFAGGGFTYGYQWPLSKHWNIEAEIGVGYNHVWYDRYSCGECSTRTASGNTNYAGVTKLGLSIMYLF